MLTTIKNKLFTFCTYFVKLIRYLEHRNYVFQGRSLSLFLLLHYIEDHCEISDQI